MKHIELLKRCHDLLRRVDTVTPDGRVSQDGDRLAKDINDYMNHVSSHFHGCWSHGPEHYMCACNHIKRLEKSLAELND
jgi:hypothetical protein